MMSSGRYIITMDIDEIHKDVESRFLPRHFRELRRGGAHDPGAQHPWIGMTQLNISTQGRCAREYLCAEVFGWRPVIRQS
jgi:hypothetical protein